MSYDAALLTFEQIIGHLKHAAVVWIICKIPFVSTCLAIQVFDSSVGSISNLDDLGTCVISPNPVSYLTFRFDLMFNLSENGIALGETSYLAILLTAISLRNRRILSDLFPDISL